MQNPIGRLYFQQVSNFWTLRRPVLLRTRRWFHELAAVAVPYGPHHVHFADQPLLKKKAFSGLGEVRTAALHTPGLQHTALLASGGYERRSLLRARSHGLLDINVLAGVCGNL